MTRYTYAVHRGRSLPSVQGIWWESYQAARSDAIRALAPELLAKADLWKIEEKHGRTFWTRLCPVAKGAP